MAQFNPHNYIDVQERINRFWSEYQDGAIRTELASAPSQFEQVVFRAEVYKHRDNPHPDATGYAAEVAGSTFKDGANFTSWHENSETSAIGRALANLGYAKNRQERPSKQEMEKVERGRPARPANGNAPPPDEEAAGTVSWTEAWKVLREKKIKNAEDFAVLTGHAIDKGLSPQEAIDLAMSCLADIEAAAGD